jgi:hypothetical protein
VKAYGAGAPLSSTPKALYLNVETATPELLLVLTTLPRPSV